ncbi:MAG: hypothetical protein WD873_00845, partial [Candidatus Hydrogenedentales bacterium]
AIDRKVRIRERRARIVDETTPFLVDRSPAVWIRLDRPLQLRIHHLGTFRTAFRTKLYVEEVPHNARLIVQAMEGASVRVNGLNAGEWNFPTAWRRPAAVNLSWLLRPGVNTIEVVVRNENGPRLLQAWSPALGLYTDASWEARELNEPDAPWTNAAAASSFRRSELAEQFQTPPQAFLRILPVILPVFVLIALWSGLQPDRRPPWLRRIEPSPEVFRGIILIAWTVLAANNLFKIPVPVGFDIEGHLNYINYIGLHRELPLATEGWQTFQAPLYYIISAVPYEWLVQRWHIPDVVQQLRIIPLLCGLANVELAYRAVRRMFPDRPDLQRLGTVAGGLLPMNLYICQYIGNEPLAATFTGLTVVIGLRMLAAPRLRIRESASIGLTWGLAILTKVTAVLLGPALVFAFVYKAATADRRYRPVRLAGHAILLGVITLLVCGWYFERNKRELGSYYMGGWDPAREVIWWQDPGYRVPEHMLGFGQSLVRPIGATGASMADAFYSTMWLDGLLSSVVAYEGRPQWNYAFLLGGVWLALIPTGLMLIGVIRAFTATPVEQRVPLLFAVLAAAAYFAAFAALYLTLPIYGTGKATYTLGLLPVYALLITAGAAPLTRHRIARATVYGAMAAWAVAAYAGYFVL